MNERRGKTMEAQTKQVRAAIGSKNIVMFGFRFKLQCHLGQGKRLAAHTPTHSHFIVITKITNRNNNKIFYMLIVGLLMYTFPLSAGVWVVSSFPWCSEAPSLGPPLITRTAVHSSTQTQTQLAKGISCSHPRNLHWLWAEQPRHTLKPLGSTLK